MTKASDANPTNINNPPAPPLPGTGESRFLYDAEDLLDTLSSLRSANVNTNDNANASSLQGSSADELFMMKINTRSPTLQEYVSMFADLRPYISQVS